uniref:Uncharacterized protein n=1 Tax=Caenorhabditis japonica TaxID=281687 RepID=A0A8R1EKG4_CAEJA
MDELSLNGGPIGDADVRIMCETPLNEERCARRENRSYCDGMCMSPTIGRMHTNQSERVRGYLFNHRV